MSQRAPADAAETRGAAGRGIVIAIVGAESSGKSTLAEALAARIASECGLNTTCVPELLRDWCTQAGRTPRRDEQAGIAAAQQARIDAAAARSDVVVCDTTPLMTAVYSCIVFGDRSLDAAALAWQAGCALTLLTALDLPWMPDGLQRDGPQVQAPVDALLREHLTRDRLPWALVAGRGAARLGCAMDAVTPLLRPLASRGSGLFTRIAERNAEAGGWIWCGGHCDVPECEHALRRR